MRTVKRNIREADENGLMSMGLAIVTTNEDVLIDNAEEKGVTLDWGTGGKVGKSFAQIELNAIKFAKKYFTFFSDEGHGSDDSLIGSLECTLDELEKFRKALGAFVEENGGVFYFRECYNRDLYNRIDDDMALVMDVSFELFAVDEMDAEAIEDALC